MRESLLPFRTGTPNVEKTSRGRAPSVTGDLHLTEADRKIDSVEGGADNVATVMNTQMTSGGNGAVVVVLQTAEVGRVLPRENRRLPLIVDIAGEETGTIRQRLVHDVDGPRPQRRGYIPGNGSVGPDYNLQKIVDPLILQGLFG
jgi:hypothetical protein